MKMKYIDIHSHLGFEDYGADKIEVINRMVEAGVGTIAVGADLESSKQAVKLASENENIWACIGQHPTHNIIETEVNHGSLGFDEVEFEKLVKNPKVVAIGECGLDYYIPGMSLRAERSKPELDCHESTLVMTKEVKERQKEIFIKQIHFALKYNKALMLHIRNADKNLQGSTLNKTAFEDVYEILSKIKSEQGLTLFRGNVHFFTGKLEMARKFIDLGFTISFVGLITYIEDFNKIIKNVPLESLQAETDAPYVAPVPHRGERNEPSYVVEVYKKIADIRGEDPETVRLQLLANAKRIFGI
jgi:TatD DNase family protein